MVCRKLALKEGDRVLDVGCGWGSFPLWAATRHGASVVGITLSPPQAEKARQRAEAAGVADRVEIRVMDYRDLAGERFDAIASIGMVEHVGAEQIDVYARTLAGLLEPGGRLLNHGITRLRHSDPEAGPVLGALRLPRRRAAAPLAGAAGARAGGLRHPPRRGVRRRLRRDPAPLGARAWTRTSTRRSASPAPNASASGASTCAPPATASKRASPRSTRPAARWPEAHAVTLRRLSWQSHARSKVGDLRSDREIVLDRRQRPVGAGLAQLSRRRSCRWRRRRP